MMKQLYLQDAINNQRLSKTQWLIFIICFLVILSDGIDTGLMGYIAPVLIDDWGISKQDLRPVMSVALIGMCLGALAAGVLADYLGRKWVIIGSVWVFAAFTLLTAFAETLPEIILYRFLTGLGLGAAMPNAATLVSEYMPEKRRAWMVNLLFCALPLGMTLGGVISAYSLERYGWQSVLYIGAFVPAIVAVFAMVYLKESLYILYKRQQPEKIKIVIEQIQGHKLSADTLFITREQATQSQPVQLVLGRFFWPSLMMWLCCFMSLLVFYVFSSWMPTLLKEANYSPEQFSLLAAIFPFGGVMGTIIIGWCMGRFNPTLTVSISYLVSALLFLATGLVDQHLYLLGLLIFCTGAGVVGAQSSLPALAAMFYPAACRGVGVSWMHGLGRLGAIMGAFFGALIFSFELNFQQIFWLLSLPVFIAALAIGLKYQAIKRQVIH
jgi:MFS transporter, AAHS family, 4-hydroxybenzoate transporter